MSAFPMRCGRLDGHEPHHWERPPSPYRPGRHTYYCHGHVVIEGGWRAQDDTDDAAEERAIQDRREAS